MLHQMMRYCFAGFLMLYSALGQATLVGDVIGGSIAFTDYNIGNCFDPNNPKAASHCNADFTNTSVDDGGLDPQYKQPNAIVSLSDDSYPNFLSNGYPEFLYSDTLGADFLDVAVDVDSSSVRVEIQDRMGNLANQLTPLAWRVDLTDLNDSNGIIIDAIISSQSSGSPFTVDFTADSLGINFLGRRSWETEADLDPTILSEWRTSGGLYANISLTAAPIPPALWLFGTGLLGVITIGRRKKTA